MLYITLFYRKHLGGMGEPIQSYNKFSRSHPKQEKRLGREEEDIDVGKAGDETLEFESKYFFYKSKHLLPPPSQQTLIQGCNVREVNCFLWAEFVNKNKCIIVRLVSEMG